MDTEELPAGITALGPDTVARVRALVAAAEQRQAEEADAALDTALGIVPRPLRGVVRKVLLG
ncbi:hypothetical protein DSM112329_03356 [Paraconexibacter sp. AEG42_29]|uniref:Uncharacterized protein n=1 Tax=Paraconexibacter sp. AEG42_29 TaxID=2997339 RepID=A0AAU7AYJ3_9ACTN